MATPLKVGFVVPGVYVYFNSAAPWPPGGSERQAYLLGQALAARGDVEVHAAVADAGQPELEAPAPRLHLWRAFRNGDSRLAAGRRLAATLRAMDADVYVFRSASIGVALGIWLAACWCRRPVVYMLAHDDETTHARLKACVGAVAATAMAWAYARPRGICAQTAAQRRAFESGRGRAVAAVVPNACELPAPAAREPVVERRTVLWVGRAQDWKRGDAFIALARRLPDTPCVMICAPSDAACEARWRTAASGLPNLTWHAAVPHAALAAHYTSARLFVSTARAEGVPNTMLEAMAAGCPVLSAAVDPDGALGTHGAGRCLGTLDEAALADACRAMLRDAAALEAMGRAARRFVETVHAPGVAAEALLKVLRQVCEAKGPSPCVA